MAINPDILKGGDKVRVKSGKVYVVHTAYKSDAPAWGYVRDQNAPDYNTQNDKTVVSATQWQVNAKYPEGRFYQASRMLKLSEIDLI
jgi:hypothetical protein